MKTLALAIATTALTATAAAAGVTLADIDQNGDRFASKAELTAVYGNVKAADFNDIDNYLLDDSQIFQNLRDIKELEEWSFNADDLTEEQLRFLQFWKDLETLYQAFKSHCKES